MPTSGALRAVLLTAYAAAAALALAAALWLPALLLAVTLAARLGIRPRTRT